MVRSKFPGKPSKIVNRKVVKANKYCGDNESNKAAENISYGLAVFCETFGDQEQVSTAFHGFSPHEVDRAKETAVQMHDKVNEEYKNSGLNFLPEDALLVKIDLPSSQILSSVAANLSVIGPVGWHTTRAQCHSLQLEETVISNSASSSTFCSPLEDTLKKHVANHLLQKAKKNNLEVPSKFVLPCRSVRSSRVIKPNKRFLDSPEVEKDNQSSHPHTRLIELKKPRLIIKDDCLPSKSEEERTVSFNGLGVSSPATLSSSDFRKEQVKLSDLNVFGASTVRPKRKTAQSQSSAEVSPKKEMPLRPSTSTQIPRSPQAPAVVSPSRSKLILRESKLNVCSDAENQKEGLFSAKPKKGLSVKAVKPPGTSMECGVCGAVCLHRLTQSLKFGSPCCDLCRKFITKMMMRARSAENSVPCENGQGNCAVSSPHKGESFATQVNRCGACWLLMCVQHLISMPEKMRDDLIRMLPANMQGMTVVLPPVTQGSQVPSCKNKRRREPILKQSPKPNASPSPKKLTTSGTKRLAQTPVARIKRKAALVSLANNLRRVRDKTFSGGSPPTPSKKCSAPVGLQGRPPKIKKVKITKKPQVFSKSAEKPLRKGTIKTLGRHKDGQVQQKITLKGPRVKHVCRSASIVLGQPLATFPVKSPVSSSNGDFVMELGDESLVCPSTSHIVDETSRVQPCIEIADTVLNVGPSSLSNPEETSLVKPASASCTPPEPNMELIPKIVLEPRVPQVAPAPGRKVTRHPSIQNQSKMFQRGYRRTLQDLGVYNQTKILPELIALDFWESYDPDEICNTGFGLIGFEPFFLKPICFLCGSAGKEKLIHCASCCEPYHQFCVGILGLPSPAQQSSKDQDGWRVDWVCPRCTVCHGCGYNTGHQLTVCQRCHHSYHVACLGTSTLRKSAGDRLSICSTCLRCKSCNSSDVSKFVGNLPFCKVCFKLRQKGNFCPLCQGCYTDDDYQSKMMECADCKSWVHAKCEGLSDEKYQVLSYLPESVEFICRLCCACPPAPWWLAVEAELQAGFINIIKAITKNRKAYAMLKWSPQKACDCQQKSTALPHSTVIPAASEKKRRLSFNFKSQEQTIPFAFQDGTDGSSVFEFDDDLEAGEDGPITRYSHVKGKLQSDGVHQEGPHLSLDCGNDELEKSDKAAQFSPNTGSQSDSGVGSTDDELKTATEEEDIDDSKAVVESSQECVCSYQNSVQSFTTLLTMKKKVHSSEYSSMVDFHRDMDQLINEADSHEVKELYHQTLQEVFPWFDPKYAKISRNFFPMSPCKPHHGSLLQYQSRDASPVKSNSSGSSQILKELLPKDANELDDDYFYSGMNVNDIRVCGFCKLVGDGEANSVGRLLYCGQNEWVHVNCALWSAEVFEEIDGALQNVSNALSRGRMIRCTECGKKGASVGCCAKKCEETLHFPCARMAGFVFMEDKNAFCSLHSANAPGKPLSKPSDFDVARPVFVELDRRKKKSVESKHVRLMIGSLLVQDLGKIIPDLSDRGLSLVPAEFCCTRLFWSSKEPWRVVRYTVRTSIRLPTPEPVLDLGYHITVDHSKEVSNSDISLNLPLCGNIPSLKNAPVKAGEDDLSKLNWKITKVSEKLSDDVKIVMSHVLDSVCSREADEEVTDVQNPADLLPPELKDAIFEDLPHDLLDGISMQDIFQDKFLSFEELSKDDSEDFCANRIKFETEKSKLLKNLKAPRELTRSKSDVLPGNSSQIESKLHQRSCSLALKLSTTEVVMDRTKFIQELRLSMKPATSVDLRYCLPGPGDKGKQNQSLSWPRIMQVDGVSNVVVSCSDEDSDVESINKVSCPGINNAEPFMDIIPKDLEDQELLCNRIECLKTVTSAALSQSSISRQNCQPATDESRKCKRRRLSRKGLLVKMQIPQLDGTNNISSDSEQEGTSGSSFPEQCDEKPVRCNRCGCTYRTEESYTRHLPSCSGDYSLTTSESDADVSEEEVASTSKSVFAPSPDSAISVSSGSVSTAPPVSPIALLPVSAPASIIGNTVSCSSTTQVINQSALTYSAVSNKSLPARGELQTSKVIATVSKVQKATASKSKTTKTSSHRQTVKLTMKGNQTIMQQQQLFQHNGQHQLSQHAVTHSLPTSLSQQPQVITMLDYQQSQQSGPTVLVQSVPSQSMVPAYLEAFQQHTGQNLQYLTTMDSNGGFGKTQYIAAVPSTVLPGAYQLQTISDSQLCLEHSSVGIPPLSGIQLAQAQIGPSPMAQTQPQVLGTLLQNPISCGVVAATEPIYETIQMFPDQSGGVLLASQPMLTCMETVVSNTYMSMSSSQFLSTSVPGMLQGSSTYSTTTTQVFQASKVDPPMLDIPTQYVVLNTHPSITDASVGKLEVMTISQPRIPEPRPVQSQAQMQIPSINLPVSVTVTNPLPPQSLPPAVSSVVTHVVKPQPQRTYSKPSKAIKSSIAPIVKKPLQPLSCSSWKETSKYLTHQPSVQDMKGVLTSVSSAGIYFDKCKIQNVPHVLPLEKVQNSTPISVPVQPLADLITTSTAPAQSITLPDPVQLNPPSSNSAKNVLESIPPTKCPPVTFSYRTHAMEKVKPKNNQVSSIASGLSQTKSDTGIKTSNAQSARQGDQTFKILQVKTQCAADVGLKHPGKQDEQLSQLSPVSTQYLSLATAPSPVAVFVAPPNTALTEKKSGTEMSDLKKVQIVQASTSSSSCTVTESSRPVIASSVKSVAPNIPVSSASTDVPILVKTSTSQPTESYSKSVTTSVNFSTPVTTTKLQSSTASGPKLLKQINQASLISEMKACPPKTQEKLTSAVSSTILKSTSQNVEVKKSDTPGLISSKDNSQASLKLLFQKQAHNGCYKVSSSPGKTESELMAVKLADINIFTNGVKDKKGGRGESENVEPVGKLVKKNQTVPEIIYEIHCQDGFSYSSTSISEAWQQVFGAVQDARASHKMPPLIHNPFQSIESSHNVMGLSNNSLKYLLEQLPGVGDCRKYRPIYHKSRLPGPGYQFKREDHDLMLKESRSGCARTEPYLSAKKYDMFSWLDSRHRCPPKLLDNSEIDALTGCRRTASTSLPMAMRYRHLRETSKTSVGVFRSDIHGRGLFCLRDIEAGEMVIEYAGEVIRNTLTDNREKYYQSKGIGCYMFKVDDNFTVDATQKGNAARFINHSCEPNCYSRVVDILGKKHIIIFAFRRIPQGEELTYDYKFPIEDEKIHCHCLARRCRKYLN